MAREKTQVVAVLPNGKEYFGHIEEGWRKAADVAADAVRKSDIRTPRRNPQTVKVQMYRMDIEDGQLVRRSLGGYNIMPYMEAMTEKEFSQERDELLADIPQEFHSYISSQAYERGHSSGMEEVINYMKDIVSSIRQPIADYTARLKTK